MSIEARLPLAVMSQSACRDRLSVSRRVFIACTDRALPTVVPADVQLRQGRLLVTVHEPALRDQLVGQVVALGIGRHAQWFRRGWRIVARGQLAPADIEDDVALPLEHYQIEGVTFSKARRSHAD